MPNRQEIVAPFCTHCLTVKAETNVTEKMQKKANR